MELKFINRLNRLKENFFKNIVEERIAVKTKNNKSIYAYKNDKSSVSKLKNLFDVLDYAYNNDKDDSEQEDVQSIIDDLNAKKSDNEFQRRDTEGTIKNTEKSISKTESNISDLKSQLSSLTQANKSNFQPAEEKIGETTTDTAAYEEQKTVLKQQIQKAEAELNQLKSDLSSAQAKLSSLKNEGRKIDTELSEQESKQNGNKQSPEQETVQEQRQDEITQTEQKTDDAKFEREQTKREHARNQIINEMQEIEQKYSSYLAQNNNQNQAKFGVASQFKRKKGKIEKTDKNITASFPQNVDRVPKQKVADTKLSPSAATVYSAKKLDDYLISLGYSVSETASATKVLKEHYGEYLSDEFLSSLSTKDALDAAVIFASSNFSQEETTDLLTKYKKNVKANAKMAQKGMSYKDLIILNDDEICSKYIDDVARMVVEGNRGVDSILNLVHNNDESLIGTMADLVSMCTDEEIDELCHDENFKKDTKNGVALVKTGMSVKEVKEIFADEKCRNNMDTVVRMSELGMSTQDIIKIHNSARSKQELENAIRLAEMGLSISYIVTLIKNPNCIQNMHSVTKLAELGKSPAEIETIMNNANCCKGMFYVLKLAEMGRSVSEITKIFNNPNCLNDLKSAVKLSAMGKNADEIVDIFNNPNCLEKMKTVLKLSEMNLSAKSIMRLFNNGDVRKILTDNNDVDGTNSFAPKYVENKFDPDSIDPQDEKFHGSIYKMIASGLEFADVKPEDIEKILQNKNTNKQVNNTVTISKNISNSLLRFNKYIKE